ncbi:2-C-methyl-D-erythritol 4-phosphate cytidylyltransferase, partial [Candidatus Omnitrophota bacterium]
MKAVCIVPSAGKGRRLKQKHDKPFVKLGGKPILWHTLKALETSRLVDEVVLVVSPGKVKHARGLIKKHGLKKVRSVVSGGRRRFDSVRNGLLKAKDADFVLIHDGVRPFVEDALIKRLLSAAKKFGAALPAIPSKQTLKCVNKNRFITKTPSRKFIWEAQTPQVFKK